jgi:hypothetical protein
VFTNARLRLRLYPDGADPTMPPTDSGDIGNISLPNPTFEDRLFIYTFQDCLRPCMRTEDYWFDVELLEGSSSSLMWYVHNGVRLQQPYGEQVPAADETFTLEIVP